MKTIEQVDRYFKFSTSQVFEKLFKSLISQQAYTLTYKNQTQKALQNVRSQIHLLIDQRPHWKQFQKQFNSFIVVFTALESKLERQAQSSSWMHMQLQDILSDLQQCECVWQKLQLNLIAQSFSYLNKKQKKIVKQIDQITHLKSQIQQTKLTCFMRMIQFARQLSEVNIVNKFQQSFDVDTIRQYGKKSSEINQYLNDRIPSSELQIMNLKQQIQRQEEKLENFINSAMTSFFQAEEEKIHVLKRIAYLLNGKQQIEVNQEELIPLKISIERVQVLKQKRKERYSSSLDHMKKTVDITLHPHDPKQTIIDHRKTFAKQCSEIEFSGPRSDNIEIVQLPLTFQELTLQDMLRKQLAQMNEYFTKCSQIQLSDMQYYFSTLKQSFKSEQHRQLVVFFLYQKAKNLEFLLLDKDQQSFVLSIINICLKKCMNRFDSRTVIKLILVALRLKSKEGDCEFYESIDFSPIRDNFEFWESTFIQTVYEYTEIMVNFYNLQLEKLKKSNIQSKKNFWSFFEPFLKMFKTNQIQNSSSIQDIFPQILKNVFTIYLALMKILHTPEQLQERLRQQIALTIQSLKLPEPEEKYLKEKLAKLKVRDENSLKLLLRNRLVLERSLSGIIGANNEEQEEKQCFTLSESIKEWEESKGADE